MKRVLAAAAAAVKEAQADNQQQHAQPPALQAQLPLHKEIAPVRLGDPGRVGRVLGTGSFGRVSLARHRASGLVCAIKALSKAHIVKNQQIAHLRSERDILRALDHPLLVRMHGCFQDEQCVYFVMEYVPGGEFFSHLKARGKLGEEAARLYAGEVLLMFEYLHSQDIVYRDLKPENLLLDAQGHLKLTDFGFAKAIGPRRTYTLCGTPDYLAPEIILNKGHGKAVDWWALGVLVYEMMAGYPPFYDDDPLATYRKILKGTVTFPSHFSVTARDLIRKLLQVDLSKRYGCLAGGVNDIKSHPWFRPLDFAALKHRTAMPPIRPSVRSADDASNFDDYSDLGPMQHAFQLSATEQALFVGF
ncbi:cAMP-dependent kinase catalytic subunit beta isoform X6 [Chlorella sorokiniana]|uniref:cAMP-dependent kinase catalytic subunit beta isoform X6 n=1 Tax=Chlorella sorokiniana TaxID=3076 RepID=A0A2P6TQ49_CHLSO|nr:cAMP-dependent kinase catalytic subunit beta isoform X6 [Chlorella sorokiniana]|eukprot:PRW56166.1 cAMP-dependent kinase catalytic subunit beta isoform X6 [Chlorella sorokiniana]